MKDSLINWKIQAAFIFTGVFVGILVTAQFQSAIPTSSYPLDELHAQQELIKSYSDDQAILKNRIVSLRKQIETKQEQTAVTVEKTNLDALNELKKEIGLESIKGEGVGILINDGTSANRLNASSSDQALVHAADLRDIVNLLFSAQAEAVSINNQRVIHSTPISSVGNTILVNNFHLLPPFNIEAVGDPDIILQSLNDPNSLVDLQQRIKNQKIVFTISTKKTIITPVYNSDFPLKFIKEVTSSNL